MVKMLITMYKSESGKILVIDKQIHAFPFSLCPPPPQTFHKVGANSKLAPKWRRQKFYFKRRWFWIEVDNYQTVRNFPQIVADFNHFPHFTIHMGYDDDNQNDKGDDDDDDDAQD